jgi:hypothetical protein
VEAGAAGSVGGTTLASGEFGEPAGHPPDAPHPSPAPPCKFLETKPTPAGPTATHTSSMAALPRAGLGLRPAVARKCGRRRGARPQSRARAGPPHSPGGHGAAGQERRCSASLHADTVDTVDQTSCRDVSRPRRLFVAFGAPQGRGEGGPFVDARWSGAPRRRTPLFDKLPAHMSEVWPRATVRLSLGFIVPIVPVTPAPSELPGTAVAAHFWALVFPPFVAVPRPPAARPVAGPPAAPGPATRVSATGACFWRAVSPAPP